MISIPILIRYRPASEQWQHCRFSVVAAVMSSCAAVSCPALFNVQVFENPIFWMRFAFVYVRGIFVRFVWRGRLRCDPDGEMSKFSAASSNSGIIVILCSRASLFPNCDEAVRIPMRSMSNSLNFIIANKNTYLIVNINNRAFKCSGDSFSIRKLT